ncbi:MAG TPA: ABC transporter permease [Gammaproteobacteria bacterium]|nr:ABC transporter permease [Gammaproteobacteria bacterium]
MSAWPAGMGKPVVLWTDGLLFLLMGIVLLFVLYARRQEHLREPWRQVAHSRVAMAAAVVLAVYAIVAVLDSLHFHPAIKTANGAATSPAIVSVLDVLLWPLRERTETTYSAPFATHAYTKEMVQQADGSRTRAYPRLRYGGAHLADPDRDETADILRTTVIAVIEAGAACTLVIGGALIFVARRRRLSAGVLLRRMLAGRNGVPWNVVLGTACLIVTIVFVAAHLGGRYHVFGTDKVGQDVFYQALKSIRTGLLIGTLTTLVMLPFAILLGVMAGYFRGWVDDVIQYLYTTLNSVPGVLLIAAAVLMLQVYMANHADSFTSIEQRSDLRLLFLCIILGITSWTGLCRLLRGEALKLREADFVQAARSLGVGHFVLLARHIVPNVMHIVMITVVLDFSGLVLAEAVLSYINIGVDPAMHSWGNMINGARLEMARDPVVWWSLAAAFCFMFVLVLAANLFADVVRDAFDPRLRVGGRGT